MTYSKPEPGSAWARICPDAFPRERLAGSPTLPEGFTRLATPLEADLICGRTTEAAFLGGALTPSSPPAKGKRKKKRPPNPVVRKLMGYKRFFEGLESREPKLSFGAVALWCWLWTCEKEGLALSTERRLAERFGPTRTTIRARLRELEAAGFLELQKRGKKGRSSTEYRVRYKADAEGQK